MDAKVVISGVGMVSPIGGGSIQTCSSVRAGIARKRVLPDLYVCRPDDPDFEDGEPVVASIVTHLERPPFAATQPVKWLAGLAAAAFGDLLEQARVAAPAIGSGRFSLFMALPSERVGWGGDCGDAFAYHFHNAVKLDVFPTERFVFGGHAAALALCAEARDLLLHGSIDYAAVGGVDSHLFAPWLDALDREYRVLSARSPDGFVPGEGAAFVLLERAEQTAARGGHAAATVRRVAVSSAGAGADEVPGGTLSRVLSELVNGETDAPVLFCDLNGEPGRAREWGFTLTRLGAALGCPVRVETPALSLGDVGAASGAFLMGLATALSPGLYPGVGRAAAWAMSDDGMCAAVLLELPPPVTGGGARGRQG